MRWSSSTLFHYAHRKSNHYFLPLLSTTTALLTASYSHITYSEKEEQTSKSDPSSEYDFVVIGYGHAGQSAVQALNQYCPSCSIAIIDPFKRSSTNENNNKHYQNVVSQVNPNNQTIHIHDKNGIQTLKFKHSMLLSTGCRGASSPKHLVDEKARSRVLELKSSHFPMPSNSSMSFPTLPSDTVFQLSHLAASQNAHVCILGSGIEAVYLALSLATTNRKSQSTAKVTLIFGDACPISSIVPRYLSLEVVKRLRSCGVDVRERTLVRYVSMLEQGKRGPQRLEIHTARSFDTLDTSRFDCDLVVVAPSLHGPNQSTAILPTPNNTYKPWSNLLTSPILSCYTSDARIAVNSELHASTHIYAAGSCAKYPDLTHGSCSVSQGRINSAYAGRVAGLNMAREYHNHVQTNRDNVPNIQTMETVLPIWQTQLPSSMQLPNISSSFLSSMGIEAICVGKCDSNTMYTHGFWWTNFAAHLRRKATKKLKQNSNNDNSTVKNMKRKTIRRKSTKSGSDNDDVTLPYVYGIGVVYYLDNLGRLRGIMAWGLPHTQALTQRLQHLIRTNAQTITTSPTMLSIDDLAEESKRLISSSFKDTKQPISQNVFSQTTFAFYKPLHRFLLPAKSSEVANMAPLKRKNTRERGAPDLSPFDYEHLFIPLEEQMESPVCRYRRPPNLKLLWNTIKETRNDATDELQRIKEEDDDNVHDSRPYKEDNIWLRQEEGHNRYHNIKEVMFDAFMQNMRQGKYSDGSEPYQVPKPPKFLRGVVQNLQSWGSNTRSSEGEEGGAEQQQLFGDDDMAKDVKS